MTLAVTDPWVPYASKKPVVPEPSTYGAVFLVVALVVIGLDRWKRRSG